MASWWRGCGARPAREEASGGAFLSLRVVSPLVSLLPPEGVPPHVRSALGDEAPLFAVQGRAASLGQALAMAYAGLLFFGTALGLAFLLLTGGLPLPAGVLVLVFGALGLFILLGMARPGLATGWYVGTRGGLVVVTRKDATRHPWSGFVPDVTVQAGADGRGAVTLATREVRLPSRSSENPRPPAPVHTSIHHLADAPAVGWACLRLIEGRGVPVSPARAASSAAASSAPGVPPRVARVLGPAAARADFSAPMRVPWEASAGRWLRIGVLAVLLGMLGGFALVGTGLLGLPSSGTSVREAGGFEVRSSFSLETSPATTGLLVAWFLVPLAMGLAFLVRAEWRARRHGARVVGMPDALAVADGEGVRLVSWSRVGGDVLVRGGEVRVPLRPPPEWEAKRVAPETLVLRDVAEPGRVERAIRARQAGGPGVEGA